MERRIKEITVLYHVCLNENIKKKELSNFIVIETTNCAYICDISNGLCYKTTGGYNIAIINDVTNIVDLYEDNGEFQSDVKIGNIESIKCYEKPWLENTLNGSVNKLFDTIIEFMDKKGNYFYLRPYMHEIYTRDNINITKYKKVINVFESGIKNNITEKLFRYMKITHICNK